MADEEILVFDVGDTISAETAAAVVARTYRKFRATMPVGDDDASLDSAEGREGYTKLESYLLDYLADKLITKIRTSGVLSAGDYSTKSLALVCRARPGKGKKSVKRDTVGWVLNERLKGVSSPISDDLSNLDVEFTIASPRESASRKPSMSAAISLRGKGTPLIVAPPEQGHDEDFVDVADPNDYEKRVRAVDGVGGQIEACLVGKLDAKNLRNVREHVRKGRVQVTLSAAGSVVLVLGCGWAAYQFLHVHMEAKVVPAAAMPRVQGPMRLVVGQVTSANGEFLGTLMQERVAPGHMVLQLERPPTWNCPKHGEERPRYEWHFSGDYQGRLKEPTLVDIVTTEDPWVDMNVLSTNVVVGIVCRETPAPLVNPLIEVRDGDEVRSGDVYITDGKIAVDTIIKRPKDASGAGPPVITYEPGLRLRR